ncbi:hypothetical protein JCM18899A_26310 [Nocardioides sp. AN3]
MRIDRLSSEEVNAQVDAHIVLPPGSDCWVWAGPHTDLFDGEPVLLFNHAKHGPVRVKEWLRVRFGHDRLLWEQARQYAAWCGLGERCVNPDHQMEAHVISWNELAIGRRNAHSARKNVS